MDMNAEVKPLPSKIKTKISGISYDISFGRSSMTSFPELFAEKENQVESNISCTFNNEEQNHNFGSTDYTKVLSSSTQFSSESVCFASLDGSDTQATDLLSTISSQKYLVPAAETSPIIQNLASAVRGKQPTLEEIRQKLFEAAQRRLYQKYSKIYNMQHKINRVFKNRLRLSSFRELAEIRLNSKMKQCDERRCKKILSIQRKAEYESMKLKVAAQKVRMVKHMLMRNYLEKLVKLENIVKLKDSYNIINFKSKSLSQNSKQLKEVKEISDFEAEQNQHGISVSNFKDQDYEPRKQQTIMKVVVDSNGYFFISTVEVAHPYYKQLIESMGKLKEDSKQQLLILPHPQYNSKASKSLGVTERNSKCKSKLSVVVVNQFHEQHNNVPKQVKKSQNEKVKKTKPLLLVKDPQCNQQLKNVKLIGKKVPKQQKVSEKVTPKVKNVDISQKELVTVKNPPCSSILKQNKDAKEISKPKPKCKRNLCQEPKKPWRI